MSPAKKGVWKHLLETALLRNRNGKGDVFVKMFGYEVLVNKCSAPSKRRVGGGVVLFVRFESHHWEGLHKDGSFLPF